MPLDPDIAAIVAGYAALGPSPVDGIAAERRRHDDAVRTLMGSDERPGVTVDVVASPGGLATLHVPSTADDLLVVYFHGGSWMFGEPDLYRPVTSRLAARLGATVLTPAYRLAPEHPFPAGWTDAYAASAGALDAIAGLGVPVRRIALAGDSAGGNFAVSIAAGLRDEGVEVAGLLLLYPSSDLSRRYPSMDELESGYLLETPDVDFPDRDYLVHPERRFDPRASPLLLPDHGELPPTVIVIAEYDPIRDHGTALADRLRAAGVSVLLLEAPGMVHGFAQAVRAPAAVAELERAADAFRLLVPRNS